MCIRDRFLQNIECIDTSTCIDREILTSFKYRCYYTCTCGRKFVQRLLQGRANGEDQQDNKAAETDDSLTLRGHRRALFFFVKSMVLSVGLQFSRSGCVIITLWRVEGETGR
eukprot:TRINITY_DN13972_c0_g1_i1.p2 TRINITY_DN13972_c0_g1~~TRINITY_DN13972_c0_g1_i1.p2  ORF type:complete len:131 (-),score=15.95 TRINITY_DN13972_c0_g1_i1:106-441(-)